MLWSEKREALIHKVRRCPRLINHTFWGLYGIRQNWERKAGKGSSNFADSKDYQHNSTDKLKIRLSKI